MCDHLPDAAPQRRSWLRDLGRETLRATTLGWELAAPIFAGVLLGHFLDGKLETGYAFTIGLLLAGVFAGFYNIWTFGARMERRGRRLRRG